MAKASKERVRDYRQRRQQELAELPDSTYPFLEESFRVWLERTEAGGDWGAAMYHLDAAGLEDILIEDENGPRSASGQVEKGRTETYDPYAGYAGSIGQAECAIDNLIAAAHTMGMVLCDYKKEKIRERLSKIERADLTDPTVRKNAMAETVKLNKILETLEKQIRITFYQWKVKGI